MYYMSVRYVRKENASDIYLRKCHRLCHVYHLYTSMCLYILYILYMNNHATVWPTVHIIWSVTYSSRLDCFRVKRIIYVFVLNETTSCICDISENCSHFIQDDWFNLISWLLHFNKKMFRDDFDWHVLDRQVFLFNIF